MDPQDVMVVYDEKESYVDVTEDIELKESEDSGSRCENLYMQFAKAIKKEKRKDEQIRQAGYADAEERKRCRACRQCSQKRHRHAASGRQCRNFEWPLHNPTASQEASRYALIRKDDGIQLETYILQDF